MKIRFMLALFAAAALVAGCEKKERGGDSKSASAEGKAPEAKAAEGKKEEGKKEEGKSGGGSTGVKECDDMLAALEKCMDKAPAEGKAMYESSLKQMREMYSKADVPAEAKAAWAASCKSSAAAYEACSK